MKEWSPAAQGLASLAFFAFTVRILSRDCWKRLAR
jgi:hypothetical protein